MPANLVLNKSELVFEWSKDAEEFFNKKRIFLDYPWKIRGVIKPGQVIRIAKSVEVESYANMAKGTFFSAGAFSYCRSTEVEQCFSIGRYCSVAPQVRIGDQEHPLDRVTTHIFTMRQHAFDMALKEFGKAPVPLAFATRSKPVPKIGHDVWIGRGALLKRGIEIGSGAVVAERSVVTKDIPPYAIVAGVPARVVRFRFPESTRMLLLASRWWDYNYADFDGMDFSNPSIFVQQLEEAKDTGRIKELRLGKVSLADELFDYLSDRAT